MDFREFCDVFHTVTFDLLGVERSQTAWEQLLSIPQQAGMFLAVYAHYFGMKSSVVIFYTRFNQILDISVDLRSKHDNYNYVADMLKSIPQR